MKRNVILLGLLWAWFFTTPQPSLYAQDESNLPDSLAFESTADYNFGQLISFETEVTNSPPLQTATLFVSTPEFNTTYSTEFAITASEGDVMRLTHNLDLNQIAVQPFTTVTYSWGFETETGNLLVSPQQQFRYDDDTFDWKTLTQAGIEMYWIADGTNLGKVGMDIALESLPTILNVVPTDVRDGVRIYLYPSLTDFRAALRMSGLEWIGGTASPEIGVIMLPADNPRTAVVDLRRRIPHELSHLMVYRATYPNYDNVPRWFDEGLAAQFEAIPNPNYETSLQEALANDTIIPFENLCQSFPTTNSTDVLIAYGQSQSLVSFIQDTYGDNTLTDMLVAFQDGADCDSVTKRVLNRSLSELERDWLNTVRPSPLTRLNQNLIWVALLVGGFLLTLLVILRG